MKFHLSQIHEAVSKCSACPHASVDGKALMCDADPKGLQEVRLFDPFFHCPIGKWKSHADRPGQSIKVGVQAENHRAIWRRAAEAVRSFASLVTNGGLVDEGTYKVRQASCDGCDKREVRKDGKAYCGQCECPSWAGAQLDNKLRLPYLTCPHPAGARPGFANSKKD